MSTDDIAKHSGRIPIVALVGRPNVGKSTLFNRLVGRRLALVDNQPGVTRDRLFSETEIEGRRVRFVDTGGLELETDDAVMSKVRTQSQIAIEEADLILFVVDARDGLTPADRDVAELLRRSGKSIVLVANKIDDDVHQDRIHDMWELGLDPVMAMSAEHGRGFGELAEYIVEATDAPTVESLDAEQGPIAVRDDDLSEDESTRIEWSGGPIRVAVVGRPNAGKSSLVNKILGEERFVASEVAGTTMDSVDASVEVDGQEFVFVDTAGMRRKRSISQKLEKFAVMNAVRSIDRADVVLLVVDGVRPPAEQDARVAALAHDRGKGMLMVATKWDLVENIEWKDKFEAGLRHEIRFLEHVPLLKVSGKTGRNTNKLFGAIVDAQRERHRRVGTGELNRFFRAVVEHHAPPIRNGRRAKLLFCSQPLVRPPTFVFTTNRVESIPGAYKRYLENRLRERYGFMSTPIWIKFRGSKKAKDRNRRG